MKSRNANLVTSIALAFSLATLFAWTSEASAYSSARYMSKKGRINIGLTGSASYNTVEQDALGGGDSSTDSTYFVLPALRVGYFLLDRVEFSIQAGSLTRSLSRAGAASVNESGLLGALGASFLFPLNNRFAIGAGLGGGYYRGASSVEVSIEDAAGCG